MKYTQSRHTTQKGGYCAMITNLNHLIPNAKDLRLETIDKKVTELDMGYTLDDVSDRINEAKRLGHTCATVQLNINEKVLPQIEVLVQILDLQGYEVEETKLNEVEGVISIHW